MRRLHRDWLGSFQDTDVMTFPMGNFVEIVINYARLKSQANQRKIAPWQEFLVLLLHGVLHVAGYDDHHSKERMKMRQAEFEWLAKVL